MRACRRKSACQCINRPDARVYMYSSLSSLRDFRSSHICMSRRFIRLPISDRKDQVPWKGHRPGAVEPPWTPDPRACLVPPWWWSRRNAAIDPRAPPADRVPVVVHVMRVEVLMLMSWSGSPGTASTGRKKSSPKTSRFCLCCVPMGSCLEDHAVQTVKSDEL